MLVRAAEVYADFYEDIAAGADFAADTPLCRDLTGDGDRDMVVAMYCCTGGSLQPWGVFTHDDNGDWKLSYASVRDNLRRRLKTIHRGVKAVATVGYAGACTRKVHNHLVRWNGQRWVGRFSRTYRLPRLPGC